MAAVRRSGGGSALLFSSLRVLYFFVVFLCMCGLGLVYFRPSFVLLASGGRRPFKVSNVFIDDPYVVEIVSPKSSRNVFASNHLYEAVMFYANWCPHCHHFAPFFRQIAKEWADTPEIGFSAIDCGSNILGVLDICNSFDVRSYPTVLIICSTALLEQEGPLYGNRTYVEAVKRNEMVGIKGGDFTGDKIYIFKRLPYRGWPEIFKPWMANNTFVKFLESSNTTTFSPLEEGRKEIVAPTDLPAVGDQHTSYHHDDLVDRNSGGGDLLSTNARWSLVQQKVDPSGKLYDALFGLLYVLRNWVFRGSSGISAELQKNLLGLLELLAFILPGQDLQKSFLIAVLFVLQFAEKDFSMTSDNINNSVPKNEDISQEDESNLPDLRRDGRRMTPHQWHKFLDEWKVGEAIQVPAIGVIPVWRQCKSVLCSIWTLFHLVTVGSVENFGAMMDGSRGGEIIESNVLDPIEVGKLMTLELRHFLAEKQSEPQYGGIGNSEKTNSSYVMSFPMSSDVLTSFSLPCGFSSSNKSCSIVRYFSANDVMLKFRSFVDNFLGCEMCREHFLKAFDDCNFDRCSTIVSHNSSDPLTPSSSAFDSLRGNVLHSQGRGSENSTYRETLNQKGLVLWMWRFHNAVNVRTSTERTSDALKFQENNRRRPGRDSSSRHEEDVQGLKMEEKENAREERVESIHLLSKAYAINYIGVDPRWPTVLMCPLCRVAADRQSNHGEYEKDVSQEMTKNGSFIITPEFVQRYNAGELKTSDFDVVKDFDYEKLYPYINLQYWMPSWTNAQKLVLNGSQFIVSPQIGGGEVLMRRILSRVSSEVSGLSMMQVWEKGRGKPKTSRNDLWAYQRDKLWEESESTDFASWMFWMIFVCGGVVGVVGLIFLQWVGEQLRAELRTTLKQCWQLGTTDLLWLWAKKCTRVGSKVKRKEQELNIYRNETEENIQSEDCTICYEGGEEISAPASFFLDEEVAGGGEMESMTRSSSCCFSPANANWTTGSRQGRLSNVNVYDTEGEGDTGVVFSI